MIFNEYFNLEIIHPNKIVLFPFHFESFPTKANLIIIIYGGILIHNSRQELKFYCIFGCELQKVNGIIQYLYSVYNFFGCIPEDT